MSYKVLLVGCGLTSALTSKLLKKIAKDLIYLEIWDKAKGIGGRMSTSRSPTCNTCIADLGAQYITALPEQFAEHKEVYDSLISDHLLIPLTANIEGIKLFPDGTKHFVAPYGMNSVVKHFLQIDDIHFGYRVADISIQDEKLIVTTKSGVKKTFDAVILTMPVPQILEVTGCVQDVITSSPTLKQNLQSVKYSSRYALGLFYDKPAAFNVLWDAKYIYNDDIFRYVALDNRKRNRKDEPDACVFHTSISFGNANLNLSIEDIQKQLVSHVRDIFPSWPEPSAVKCQKWLYSQVLEPYISSPGYVILLPDPLVIAGGDGFASSNFDGCLSSAVQLVEVVTNIVKARL